ncbi:unnamed protein product [Thlaspi arvense]|uniref:Uncharacterized protein n=1 Tax=Thlaspi arvense TaxID=13288 RepID=A0AAU9STZ3_THLAR|nr:unnamed protein product [Thlaspi arvense]
MRRLDKIRDSNRQSKQLDELTEKMRECKRRSTSAMMNGMLLWKDATRKSSQLFPHDPFSFLLSLRLTSLGVYKADLTLSVRRLSRISIQLMMETLKKKLRCWKLPFPKSNLTHLQLHKISPL